MGQAERLWRWCERNPAIAGLFGAVAASILVGTIVSTTFGIWAMRNAKRADRLAAAERKAALKAIEEKESSDRLRYVAEINAAVRDYQAGKMARVRTRLANLIPSKPNEIDLRGFEWHHLQGLLNQSLKVFAMPSDGVGPIAFSPDGRRLVVGGGDGVYEWDTVEAKQLAKLKISGGIESVAYGPTERIIVVNHAPWGEVKPEWGYNGTILHTSLGPRIGERQDDCPYKRRTQRCPESRRSSRRAHCWEQGSEGTGAGHRAGRGNAAKETAQDATSAIPVLALRSLTTITFASGIQGAIQWPRSIGST